MLPVEGPCELDLYVNGQLHGGTSIDEKGQFLFEGLPAGEKKLEMWLSQKAHVRLMHWLVDEGATLALPEADTRKRWTTYGSSITQSAAAASPSMTWPAIVSRERGLNLTCLGFSGQCHLDPLVARIIRDRDADYISICAGVNIQGGSTLNARTFPAMLAGFIRIIREKHERTPVVVVSPVYAPQRDRENTPNAVGLCMKDMRTHVRAVVDALQRCGDEHLAYVDGLDVFGPELAEYLPDGLHPDAEGYKRLARNFMDKVVDAHFKGVK